jgi:hypothetical protein
VIALEVTLAESPRATVQASAEARRPMLDQGWMMGEPPTAGGRRVSFARGGGSERGGPLDSSPVPDQESASPHAPAPKGRLPPQHPPEPTTTPRRCQRRSPPRAGASFASTPPRPLFPIRHPAGCRRPHHPPEFFRPRRPYPKIPPSLSPARHSL